MISKDKTYSNLILLCWLTIIFCWIIKLCGYKEFEIPVYIIDINIWIRRIINLILYYVNGIFFLLLMIKRTPKIKEILLLCGLELIPFTLSFCIDYPILLALRIPLEYIIYFLIGWYCLKDKWWKVLLEAVNILTTMLLYQIISELYKNINLNISVENFIVEKILLIDYYMLLILTTLKYMKKGGYIYGWRWCWILANLSKLRFCKKTICENEKPIQESIEPGFRLFIVLLSIFQLSVVGTVCYFINNVTWQFIIIFVSFVVMRKCFGKSYHANSVIVCTTLSCVVFVCATKLSLPSYISVLCNVLIGCLVAYMMYVMYYFVKYTTAQGVTIRRGMSKDALLEVCYTNNLNEFETNLLIDFYCNKYSAVFLARKYGYSSDNIHKIKAKLLKRIRNS